MYAKNIWTDADQAKKENIFASCSGLAPVFVSGSLQQLG